MKAVGLLLFAVIASGQGPAFSRDEMAVYRLFLGSYAKKIVSPSRLVTHPTLVWVGDIKLREGCLKGLNVQRPEPPRTALAFDKTLVSEFPLSLEPARYVLQLSEVAFDSTRSHAVVQYSYGGDLSTVSGTVAFEKTQGRWQRMDRDCGEGIADRSTGTLELRR